MRLEETILRESRGLFEEGGTVLCALSGGADSTALLLLLCALQEKLSIRLIAAHVHHGIRGAEADEDAAFCKTLAARLGIPFYCAHYDVPALAKERGESLELCARRVRYAYLKSLACALGADAVATAHNAGDALETALFNLARGTGIRGIAGIEPVRTFGSIKLVRPLLGVSRAQIEEYLSSVGQSYRTDSTNASDGYSRNRIRHQVIPALESVNPGLLSTSVHTLASLRDAADFLEKASLEAFHAASDGGALKIDVLTSLHPVLRAGVIELFYRDRAGEDAPQLESVHILKILALCEGASPSAGIDLPGGMRARREYGSLFLEKGEKTGENFPDLPLEEGEEAVLAGRFRVRLTRTEIAPADYKNVHNLVVDCSKIYGKLSFGARRPGEQIHLAGHRESASLKKLMIDRRIPREKRGFVPVIRDEMGIAACAMIGVDERCAIDENTKALYIFTIEEV